MGICKNCIIPDSFPGVKFVNETCNYCIDSETDETRKTVPGPQQLSEIIKASAQDTPGSEYDCLVPISGGKDSSFILYYVVKQLNLKPLAVFFDSCFTVDMARRNVENICTKLGVDLVIEKQKTDYRKKAVIEALYISKILRRFWRNCTNCENNLRTVVTKVALAKNIPCIIWGSTDFEHAEVYYDKNTKENPFRHFGNKNLLVFIKAAGKLFSQDSKIIYRGLHHLLKYSYFVIRDNISLGMPFGLKALNPLTQVSFENSHFKVLYFFDYIDYRPKQFISVLKEELEWEAPSGKEARMDCTLHCLQNYAYLVSSGLTADGFSFANLVRHGLMSKTEAQEKESIIRKDLKEDCLRTLSNLGFTDFNLHSISDFE